ncbi:hypothetical protein A7W90_13035 [Clostridium sp. Bc-iso-3]|nr:hypothetical protein A7W90_13035 [Clostridium sp. Bc-iso-3]
MKKRLIAIFILVTMLFTMLPAEAMAVMADKVNTAANTVQGKKYENPFIDVPQGSWYYDAVLYSRINGFFSGTSANTFNPDGTMTRGMFVTVLGQMAGVDETIYKGQSDFSDVASDAYYAPFVAWASKHGITAGVGNGKFDPDGIVTREQMAVFFVCYFEKFGVDFDTGANITTVPADLDTVSPWAREMVLKLWRTGLLAGDGTNFNPSGNASRAQAATLCMVTDKAVKVWYREPGVPSDRVSIDPKAEQKPETSDSSTENTGSESNTGDSSSGRNTGSSNNGSKTNYYKVTFMIDSTKEEKLYQKDILLSSLQGPGLLSGKVFLGWYYDAEYTNPVAGNDRLNSDITLYAKLTDGIALDEGGIPNFVSALDQKSSFTVAVKKADSAPIVGTDFKFRNITSPDKTPEGAVAEEDLANIESVKVEGGNGLWIISSANGGFIPGHTYQIELINDDVIYEDSAEAFEDLKAINGYDIAQVRFFNFSIEKDGTLNLKLDGGIKYIPVDKLSKADGMNLMEYAGLYLASTDEQGNTTYTASNGSGSFTYTGTEDIQVGDTVAVYSGTKPTERLPEKGTENKTNNGDVSYVKITDIDTSTYYYVAAEAEDVIFTPDVLPVDVDNGDGTTGWKEKGTSVVIDNSKLDFSDTKFEIVGLSAETTVDVGDFLVFYTGDFGDDNAQDIAYGEITKITSNEDGTTTITYKEVKEDKIMSAMDLYDEKQLSEAELTEVINKKKNEIQEIVEAQLMESNFFDEAGEYLAELALQTDEVREVFGDGLTLSNCTITYADGTPLGADELTLMGNIIDKDQKGKKPQVSCSISTKTAHFDPKVVGTGVRVEVAVSYEFKIQRKGNNNIMEVNLTAFFEQEFTFGFNVSGGAVWKWKWKIIPYISDYRLTGNLDIGTYTGIGITATAKLTQDKEPWGMPWPKSAREAAATKKIFSLSESIKELMEEIETVLPEEEATASGGLAEKYARFMEDANEEWVDLVSVSILDLRSAVDPLHILAFGLQVDFVVSANLNVAIGMTFQYENFKRHSFTLLVLSKKGENETIDLSTNGYQLDFYVMGTIGIRAGVRVKVTAGLFSTKLAAIGLQFETGAYARMWGYFYYHLENWKVKGVWQKNSGYSGALLVEIGAYLDVKFIAEALNGKYSYTPSIYTKEWPLWSAGQRENVYDFAYEDDPTFNILNVDTYTLPKTVFDMYWMDLKTGEIEDKIKNFDSNTAPKGDDEAYFIVELSNPAFSYNPVNNKITINTSSGAVTQSSEMKIIWKGTSLSTSSETLSRTIKLNWSNEANAGTIAFDSNGGSAVQMLRLLAGTALSGKMPAAPTKLGYTFAGWYTDKELNNAFTATTMPKGNTTLYAKWTPNDASYIVEHYQKTLDGQYVLVETDKTNKGKVDAQTSAAPKSYVGFTAQSIKQQTIAPDGSTRVAIYYDRNLYDLKYVYGNGSNDVALKVPYGAEIVKPSNPTKEGYSFAGWDADIPGTMPAKAMTFTAKWTASTNTRYAVKHYKQELNGEYVLEQVDGMFGTTGENTSAKARTYTGFTAKKFDQKTIMPDGSTVVEICYDRNTNSLSWNVNGGNSLTGEYTYGNVIYGTTIKLPDTPSRTGYSFVGWYKDEAMTSPLEDKATMPDVSLILHAKWKVNQYKITFDSSGGSTVAAITQDYGTVVKEPTAPTKAGYTFAGWKLNGADYTFTSMPAENITLIAEWTALSNIQYTVEHYMERMNGSYPSTPDETDHLYGSTGAVVSANAKGYTGFTYDPNVSGTISSGIVKEDGSLVLKLYYKRNSYNLSWDGNGGNVDTTGATTGSVKYGATIISPTNNPTKTGYTFKEWSGYDNNMTMPAKDITFTAEWKVNQYKITFDSNGGSAVAAITQDYGTAVNAPADPTKGGYVFAVWKLNGVDYTFTTMPAEDITLVAEWTIDINIPYTVEYYMEKLDGTYPSMPDDTDHLKGMTGAVVNANAKGYTGFTYDPNVSGTVSSGIVAEDGSLVLKLFYKRNSYNVTWNGNGGDVDTTGATTGSVKYGAAIASPVNNPTKTGYNFSGWSGYAVNMTMPAEHITFIASWTAKQYTITFDSDGGSEVAAITQDYGTVVKAPTAPTKAGFKFVGWQLNGENYTFTTMSAEDIILVAVWDEVPTYTVTFDANGGTVDQTDKYVYEGETYGEMPVPTNGDKFFLGWYTAKSGGTKVTSETVVELAANHTLYACWADTGFTGSVNPNLTIYVAGVKVTTENMNDILGDGSGSVQFDPNSTVVTTSGSVSNAGNLYLNNATISGTSYYSSNNAAIYTSHSMTIVNKGNSTVTNTFDDLYTSNNVYGIYISGIANIKGSGTLTVTSGQGGNKFNCGIRTGLSGAHLTITGVKVEVFAGTAGSNGSSYGACVGPLDMEYKLFLNEATLEAHGYDSAVYCGDPNFPYTGFLTAVNTYIGGTDYYGTDAESITQTEEYQYRNYKYIFATVQ